MRTLGERIAMVARLRPASRRAAFVAAVHASRGAERASILTAALTAGERDPDLLAHLATLWPDLSPEARDAIASTRVEDLASIGDRIGSGPHASPDAAAALCARTLTIPAIPRRIALIAGARLAAHLRNTVAPAWVLDEVARASRDPESVAHIDEALAAALEGFGDHRHEPTLMAALRAAARPGPKLAEWLRGVDDPGHFALRSAVRRVPNATFAELAVPLLGAPSLAPIAATRIGSLTGDDAVRIASEGHRLRVRSRVGALRRAGQGLGSKIAPSAPIAARRGAIDWVSAAATNPADRCARLADRLTDPDAGVRLRAVRALRSMPPSPAIDRVLMDFALDASEPVAIAATGALALASGARRRDSVSSSLRMLTRSPHAGVRARASRALEAMGYADDAHGRRIWRAAGPARRSLRTERERTIRDLITQVSEGATEDRLDGVRVIERLGLGTECLPTLVRLLDGTDPRIAASVVRPLARSGNAVGHAAIVRALGHGDARVRANALEELHRTHTPVRATPPAEAFADDPTPRIRANAVHATLRRRGDDEATRARLAAMLADPRPPHRRSGLWVVERLAVLSLAPTVADLVRREPDPEVRTRAIRCGKRLLDHLIAQTNSARPAHHDTPKDTLVAAAS